jgi:hypothetical protein
MNAVANSLVVSYAGRDPQPHPWESRDTCCRISSATSHEAAAFLEIVRARLSDWFAVRPEGSRRPRPAYRLRIWSKTVDDSAIASCLLAYRLRYDLTDTNGQSIATGTTDGICAGPAGPNRRIDSEVKAKHIVPLCAAELAANVERAFIARNVPENAAPPEPALTLWLRLFVGSLGERIRRAEPPYLLDADGVRYDLQRNRIGRVADAGGTIFRMSDRQLPASSKGPALPVGSR